jgi:transposase-like protein
VVSGLSAGGRVCRRRDAEARFFGGIPSALHPGMHWPIQPAEIQRRFVPRFCPRPDCPQHRLSAGQTFRYKSGGGYRRRDGRRVPRYRCLVCGKTSSKQSFAVSYFLKRPELLVPTFAGLQAGSGHRQLARSLGCAPSTVTRLSARLGRHALLLTATALAELGTIRERLVLDHFESFVRTQDYPVGVATVVGKTSWFVYALDPAPHARTGKRSRFQEAKRKARPPQPTRGGYTGSMIRVLDALVHFFPEDRAIRLTTDGLPGYIQALTKSRFRGRFRHTSHPNPKRGPKGAPRSRAAVARDRAMFPVDTLHGLLRHSECHHRRETIAFGRRTNAILERLYLASAWRNFVKGVSERKPERTTPAMKLKLATEPWSWSRVLARRLFPGRVKLPKSWLEIYRRAWITPGGPNTRHELALAD